MDFYNLNKKDFTFLEKEFEKTQIGKKFKVYNLLSFSLLIACIVALAVIAICCCCMCSKYSYSWSFAGFADFSTMLRTYLITFVINIFFFTYTNSNSTKELRKFAEKKFSKKSE